MTPSRPPLACSSELLEKVTCQLCSSSCRLGDSSVTCCKVPKSYNGWLHSVPEIGFRACPLYHTKHGEVWQCLLYIYTFREQYNLVESRTRLLLPTKQEPRQAEQRGKTG